MNSNELSYSADLDRSVANFTNVLRALAYQNFDEAARQYKVAIRTFEFAVMGARSMSVNVNLLPDKLQRIAELTVDIETIIAKHESTGWNALIASIKALLATVIRGVGLPVPQALLLPSGSSRLRLGGG
jgi:hypothetical protein